MKTLRRYLEIYSIQIKNNWVREAVYRSNFLTSVIVDLIWMAVEVSLFSVIYSNVPVLAGWTKPQAFFFLGVFFSSDAIFTTFFQRNFWMFSDLVNKGELDILLTKPVSPLFLCLTRWISLTSIFNFFMGLAVAIHFSGPAGLRAGFIGSNYLSGFSLGSPRRSFCDSHFRSGFSGRIEAGRSRACIISSFSSPRSPMLSIPRRFVIRFSPLFRLRSSEVFPHVPSSKDSLLLNTGLLL